MRKLPISLRQATHVGYENGGIGRYAVNGINVLLNFRYPVLPSADVAIIHKKAFLYYLIHIVVTAFHECIWSNG